MPARHLETDLTAHAEHQNLNTPGNLKHLKYVVLRPDVDRPSEISNSACFRDFRRRLCAAEVDWKSNTLIPNDNLGCIVDVCCPYHHVDHPRVVHHVLQRGMRCPRYGFGVWDIPSSFQLCRDEFDAEASLPEGIHDNIQLAAQRSRIIMLSTGQYAA